MNINPINISTGKHTVFNRKPISKPVINLATEDEFLINLVEKHGGMIIKYMEMYKLPKITLARKVAPEKFVKLPFYQENYGSIFINSGTKTTYLDLNAFARADENMGKNLERKFDKEFLTAVYDNIRLNNVIPKKGLSYEL
ncbi:hypothetical protein IJD34_07410 [bacterium]|nr:hypothetical protein [bacterium]